MSETLGSLCDKLIIVKLKQYHSDDPVRLESLGSQEKQLKAEINDFIIAAISGHIPLDRLTFSANKIYKKEGNVITEVTGSIGEIFARFANINSALWHEQEKVYEFEKVPPEEKDKVVKRLALLNLERNSCIDRIDKQFCSLIEQRNNK